MPFLNSEIQLLVEAFWSKLPTDNQFPRDLETILWAHQLEVVFIENLNISKVYNWLHQNNSAIPKSVKGVQRRIFGCLVAFRGGGYIFVDANASKSEQRFTIAHEVGHFLRDYMKPRIDAIEKLGDGVIAVLDGDRHASDEERVHAMLSSVKLTIFMDLLLRGENNEIVSNETDSAEIVADNIAMELLAPHSLVLSMAGVIPYRSSRESIRKLTFDVLQKIFDLPEQIASYYSLQLAHHFKKQQTVRDWLNI